MVSEGRPIGTRNVVSDPSRKLAYVVGTRDLTKLVNVARVSVLYLAKEATHAVVARRRSVSSNRSDYDLV